MADEKSSFELLVSVILFMLIWIVSTTENKLQGFSMAVMLFLVALLFFLKFIGAILSPGVKSKAVVFQRNSDILVFSFLGIVVGWANLFSDVSYSEPVNNWLWLVSALMMLSMIVRLALNFDMLRSFEKKTETKEVKAKYGTVPA